MRVLNKPVDDAATAYAAAISGKSNSADRAHLDNLLPDVLANETEFADRCNAVSCHAMSKPIEKGSTSATQLKNLYDDNFARARSTGRPIYDRIMAAAPRSICPLCKLRTVSTLDHFLPKATYPLLAVTPLNLVPCCSDCNKKWALPAQQMRLIRCCIHTSTQQVIAGGCGAL
jgi:hypothetical protein